jgi:hypothetical protein
MYFNPHAICALADETGGLARAPILLAGRLWGMPYAPLDGFFARLFQPLSRVHSLTSEDQLDVPGPHPYAVASAAPIALFFVTVPPTGPLTLELGPEPYP